MRDFTDSLGGRWRASVREEGGPDYKGRVYMVLEPLDAETDMVLELPEVRWNSMRTAKRTIETMSEVELRRRLRAALGRRSPVGQSELPRTGISSH